MLGTTTTTTTTLGASANSHSDQPLPMHASTNYLCASCHVSFQNGQEQRLHMREPWHLYNVKRRMTSLRPISREAFDAQGVNSVKSSAKDNFTRIRTVRVSRVDNHDSDYDNDSSSSTEMDADEDISKSYSTPFQCLFCAESFPATDDGLDSNLTHMLITHDFSIPHQEAVLDLQSFVGYLATEVRTWHECLYCGTSKSSTQSLQNHMRDKQHCALNLDREPELRDFWDPKTDLSNTESDSTTRRKPPTRLSDTEMRLKSGKVVASRQENTTRKPRSQLTETTAMIILAHTAQFTDQVPPVPSTRASSSGQLAHRDEMALTGISPFQRQQLAIAVKKAQRSEAVAQRARDWIVSRGANNQKFDQIDTTGKWGKQNHKLQPR